MSNEPEKGRDTALRQEDTPSDGPRESVLPPEGGRVEAKVAPEHAGWRVDRALAALFPGRSRATLQRWLAEGRVKVAGQVPRQSAKLSGGESVVVDAPAMPVDPGPRAEAIALNVVYEDEHLLVLDKPAGLVAHPGAGNPDGTLVNALLHFDPSLTGLPRAGVVHRLDKDTSGLMVVARNEATRLALIDALAEHRVQRTYTAIVRGTIIAGSTIDAPIGRHPRDRLRMAVVERGRPAVTHYRLQERFRRHTQLRVDLETGRTHQIRVHFAHIDHPLVGDALYGGGRAQSPAGATEELALMLRSFPRQALHASALALVHPVTDEDLRWQSPLPSDIKALIACLRADVQAHSA